MHLKSLRLSGFKSFVEPTVLHFPDALCGVVGPNGCGKSNIVDALRWVMGATSSQKPARQRDGRCHALRGLPPSSKEAGSLRLMVNMPEHEAQP